MFFKVTSNFDLNPRYICENNTNKILFGKIHAIGNSEKTCFKVANSLSGIWHDKNYNHSKFNLIKEYLIECYNSSISCEECDDFEELDWNLLDKMIKHQIKSGMRVTNENFDDLYLECDIDYESGYRGLISILGDFLYPLLNIRVDDIDLMSVLINDSIELSSSPNITIDEDHNNNYVEYNDWSDNGEALIILDIIRKIKTKK